MAEPKYSVSEITTFHSTFDEDLANYVAGGAEGIGIWEFKLPEGNDAESIAKLRDSGLAATTCIPGVLSVYPVPFPGPTDPRERAEAFLAAVRRFVAFEPAVILTVTGHPGDVPFDEARPLLVKTLKEAAKIAGAHGTSIGLEPLHRDVYGSWSMIGDIPGTVSLLDEIDEPNAGILFDVYHLWDTDDVLGQIERHGHRIVPSVHICDWREDTRNDFDRALPGDGIIDLPVLFGALEAAGATRWLDLEIFSDDGSFTDMDFEDSLWKQDPVEIVKRGKAGFERAWAERKAPA